MPKKEAHSVVYGSAIELPEQIEEALKINAVELPATKKICVCGMGAAALAGEVFSDYIDGSSDIPLSVIRGIELPGWVSEGTTVIALSYSGNTEETVIAYEEARSRGCEMICITSGGELGKRCTLHNTPVIKLPPGLLSRDAFGYLLGSLAVILETMNISDAAANLRELVPELKRYRDARISDDDRVVKDISEMLVHKIPVIFSLANMRSSAIRWKTQINENSKFLSFCGSLPEFNHNEIVGWTGDAKNNIFMPVILYDDNASDIVRWMIDASSDVLRDRKIRTVTYHIGGPNNLEKNLKCIILGDIVSVYLADLIGSDRIERKLTESRDSLVINDDSENS
jgi:Glucose-6-phosphate isomerase